MSPGNQPKFSPNFSKVITDLSKGTILKPLLHSYLFDAKFPKDFSVDFHHHVMARKEDGWFHPSTHPLWPARKLWLYARHTDQVITQPKEYMGTLSVTIGHAVHSFIQMCLKDLGVLEAAEVYVEDPVLRSRGSMDGVLTLDGFPGHPRQMFEFKTSNLMKLSSKKDLDIDTFRETWPDYYMQVQEYMRLSGIHQTVLLFMAMGYPWELREFHIPYNPALAQSVVIKYREALGDVMPAPCCGPGSKTSKACELRAVCPIARM
jgi:hypothetical protein